jgi:hypothetical protein
VTFAEVAQSISWCWSSIVDVIRWEDAKGFFNSAFTTSLLGSLAGAFAGAVAAQRIVERGKRREELLSEIRNTNAAIVLAFGVCNLYLTLKKQSVKAMGESYCSLRKDVLAILRKQEAGGLRLTQRFRSGQTCKLSIRRPRPWTRYAQSCFRISRSSADHCTSLR